MKKIIFIFIFLSVGFKSASQNGYYRLYDATGINTNEYQAELNAVATQLINAFPEEFRSNFKVYDFGFYLHHEPTQGFPDVFEAKKNEISAQSLYYLIFGRQNSSKGLCTKIWVDMKLPNTGQFQCIDLISTSYRNDLTNLVRQEVEKKFNEEDKQFHKYKDAEIAGIERLKKIIIKQLDCCAPAKGTASCSACLFENDPVEFMRQAINLGIFFFPVVIANDVDFEFPTATLLNSTNGILNTNVKLSPNDSAKNIDSLINVFVQNEKDDLAERIEGIDTSCSIFKVKYPADCSEFSTRWSSFNSLNSGLNIFVCLVNFDNKIGFLGMKIIQGNSISAKEDPPGIELRTEELRLLKEDIQVQDDNSCFDLGWAKMKYASQYYIPKTAALLVRSNEDAEKAYEIQHVLYSDRLAEAEHNYSLAWEREYGILLEKKGLSVSNTEESATWSYYICSWTASYHLCSNAIHTILDLCGVVEVLGTLCDGTNAILYLIEDDYANAGMAALSVVPVVGTGIAATKYGRKIVTSFASVKDCLIKNAQKSSAEALAPLDVCHLCTFARTSDGFFSWGYKKITHSNIVEIAASAQSQFKLYMKNLGVNSPFTVTVNGKVYSFIDGVTEAHHIIPWEIHGINVENKRKKILEMAAYAGWHPNDPRINGFPLPQSVHRGNQANHPKYTEYVKKLLDKKSTEMINSIKDKLHNDPGFRIEFIDKNGLRDYAQMSVDDFIQYLEPKDALEVVTNTVSDLKELIWKIETSGNGLNTYSYPQL